MVKQVSKHSPFHRGELEVQQLTGVTTRAAMVGGLIQSSIPATAFELIRQQAFVWLGLEDNDGLLWGFPLTGLPGFIDPAAGEQLNIRLSDDFPVPEEWFCHLQKGKSVGCLIIDFSTRRRIRINGVIRKINKGGLVIAVEQAYPNCPKYIRKRELNSLPDFSAFEFKSSGNVLDTQLENIITQSDTAFVASLGPNGADVSHRGGCSGFIQYAYPDKLLVPDYAGNNMFNTLGNFKVNPAGALLIVDFSQAYYLQLSGKIKLLFSDQPRINTGGTNRYWAMDIDQWRLFHLKSNFKWNNLSFSPFNP